MRSEEVRARHRENQRRSIERMTPSERDEYNARRRVQQAAWRSRNVEKMRAHQAVRLAMYHGTLVRPDCCQECGSSSRGRIEAAHTDYSKALEVEWLCVLCHRVKDLSHA